MINPSKNKTIILAKMDAMRTIPFLSFLIMGSRYYENDTIPTGFATTDNGGSIHLNPTFIESIPRIQACFVILHEVLHLFFLHTGRQIVMGYCPHKWNYATDYCINAFLKAIREEDKMEVPDWVLYKSKYGNKGADEIYALLPDIEKTEMSIGGGGDGDGHGHGTLPGEDKTPLDHVSKKEGNQDQLKAQISASLANVSDDDMKNMGEGARDLLINLREMFEPKISWKSVLQQYVSSVNENRYSYARPSRKSGRIIFPTMKDDHINVVYGIDTSGSMSNKDYEEVSTELLGILDNYDSWSLDLVSCDEKLHKIGTFNSEEDPYFTAIDIKLVGGGGTELSPMINYAQELDEDSVSVCIISTDGWIPEIDIVGNVPVIFLVTSAGKKDFSNENSTAIFIED